MTSGDATVGIVYPDRAEGVGRYSGYKVFVDFWEPLTDHLAEQFRVLRLRGQTKILAIYGEQGSGKTLFSTQLLEDHAAARRRDVTTADDSLWHRIARGAGATDQAVRESTAGSVCRTVPDEMTWIDSIKKWRGAESQTSLLAIADNAETDYFLRGLVGDRYPNATRSNDAYLEAAAGNLVKEARREDSPDRQGLTGMLLIMLSNDKVFLEAFKAKMDTQHRGMMEIMDLPLPTAEQKERAVRVNVNRLNDVSYWYCLDKGGESHQKQIRSRLVGATTFPDTFDAVDQALRFGTARTGRPGKKNLLTLVCLSKAPVIDPTNYKLTDDFTVEAQHAWAASYLLNSGWGVPSGLTGREAGLIESEWQLRLVALGEPFVAALLAAEPTDATSTGWSANSFALTAGMLRVIQKPLGPTSRKDARDEYVNEIKALVAGWLPDITAARSSLDDFWRRGQGRSSMYERQLELLLGTYNRTTPGYLNARPDFVVEDFVPAALTTAKSDSKAALIKSIQRSGNAMEFTSQETVTPLSLAAYLRQKLPNYILATQEQ